MRKPRILSSRLMACKPKKAQVSQKYGYIYDNDIYN